MKVKFYLERGGFVELELERVSQVRMAIAANKGWLWDNAGHGVRLDSVSAVEAVTPEELAVRELVAILDDYDPSRGGDSHGSDPT